MKPRLLLVLCLAAVTLTSNVALSENEQKKHSKQPNQKVSSPSRATLPASKAQRALPQAQKARPPAVQSPRAAPTKVQKQPLKPQSIRPPVKQVKPGQLLRQPSAQPSASKLTTINSGPPQPVAPLVKPSATKPKALATPSPSTSQSHGLLGKSSKAASADDKHKGQVQPSKKEKPQAKGKEAAHKGDDKSPVADKDKFLRGQQKHQDSNSSKSAAKTNDKKADKPESGDKYGKLSRNELEKAIENELGHTLDKKYGNMSKRELRNELASLKGKDKDKKLDKPDLGKQYENLSRKELRDAIAKEKGEPLNDHYKKMSKNELAKELAGLKEKGGNTKTNSNSNNPESWSKDQLKNHIKQLTDSLGEKYKKNYDKQSQRELVNSYKALAAEKAQKDALAKKQPGSENNPPSGSQAHSSAGGGLDSFRGVLSNQSANQQNQSERGQNVSHSTASGELKSFRGVLANQLTGQQTGSSQGKPERVNPLSEMKKGGFGWNVPGLPGVKYAGDGQGGVIDGRHNGVDLKASPGTPVKAPEKGNITKATYDKEHGQLTLEMVGESGYKYEFIHMGDNPDLIKALKKNGNVPTNAGDQLGVVGDAKGDKWASGPHLHISVMKDGKFVDPDTLFKID
jgi:murein DD-endopeptidase MepM/ murein hydrolase activator NlpD